jgi:2',3'-cyclic-nucleotide 2'-phosphodiesterase (5'-nucleotidase family)
LESRLASVFWILPILFAAATAWPEPRSLLILHTNDLHDHVRADYDGSGGLAYVSGYIKSEKASRNDVLVLDAGDVMEKGDLVAYRAKSTILYEAISKIGYDAIAPGNHDDSYGDAHLVHCASLAPDTAMLAINLTDADGNLRFAPSKVFERNGLKVGVIGVFKPRDEDSLDLSATIAAISEEARRLEASTHLIVVVAHLGPKVCKAISEAAPEVDIFVSGHTHQALQRPLIAKATGALIVQAGSNAEYVGRLELSVDDVSGEILDVSGSLVPMDHKSTPHDGAMQVWFAERERELSPDADRVIVKLAETLGYMELAYLGAEGIRLTAEADIAFCHVSQIIRATLPPGVVDVNAIFRTGGQRGYDVIGAELTGREIEAYIEGLANSGWGNTQWSGFRGRFVREGRRKKFSSNLDPDQMYRIAMPLREWDTRLMRLFGRDADAVIARRILSIQPERMATTFTKGVVALIEGNCRTPGAIAQSLQQASILSE